jgi:hypothetical protein
LEQK